MQKLPSRIHVIGICGVATSALAIAFHEKGVKVTGSDKGFFPPVSTELEKHGVAFYAGWHPEKMIEQGVPDVIIVGTASGSQNPETLYAQEHNIRMYSFAEAVGEFLAQKNSIVCVGTWGKTSSTALLSFILHHAGWDPTYMFGGVSLSHPASAHLSHSGWNVFEGDEYKSSPTDPTAKFFYYKPTHLLLTAVSWDHADLYPTEAEYFAAFRKLLQDMPEGGCIAACVDHVGVMNIVDSYKGPVVKYGRSGIFQQGCTPRSDKPGTPDSSSSSNAEYTYDPVIQSKDGLNIVVHHGAQQWTIFSPMLGTYQAENITGCFALAHHLGIAPEKIVESIAIFKGLKRRLEKRVDGATTSADITVLDDIAHSPEKASSVLATLRTIYPGKIIAIFEPNIGGRERGSRAKYDNAFANADTVIIPRLTKLKVAEDAAEQPMEGDELATTIRKTHTDTQYIDDDAALVSFVLSQAKKDDVIVFLGSHGFRGMIEEVVEKLK